jgi:hypothetical protein
MGEYDGDMEDQHIKLKEAKMVAQQMKYCEDEGRLISL